MVVSFSQILITYEGAPDPSGYFWPLDTSRHRSRADAFRLANQLASDLHKAPKDFGLLAGEFSDDVGSRARGGYVGVWHAASLPGTIVDAFGEVPLEQISHIVESVVGFHILQRHMVPPNAALSGDEIVVGFGSSQENWAREEKRVTRSREDALELAARVRHLAIRSPDSFPALVQQYSDDRNSALSGDLGRWTLYDPQADPNVLTALSATPIGGVAELVEDREAIHVLKRKIPPPVEWLKVDEIVLTHEDSRVSAPLKASRTIAQARRLGLELLQILRVRPSAFAELQKKYCPADLCTRLGLPFQKRRRDAVLEGAVAQLSFGEIGASPVETPAGVHILRRLEVSPEEQVEAADATFEIPRPPLKNVDAILRQSTPEAVAAATRKLAQLAAKQLELPNDKADAFQRILNETAAAFETQPHETWTEVREKSRRDLTDLLGASTYDRFSRIRDDFARESQLL
ncbi:MAG TPA: peptidylprolyl isomerase [Polyangiaceae bacterium]|nr:peptidylprolyl isomerase [Polyangiaceae bacterium]